jgi:prepilin-type N-terminal cleavage/methylation domain-containing protein
LLGCVRRGFTLVELVVVLIVTGVTCTVALPRLRDTPGVVSPPIRCASIVGRHRLGRAPVLGQVKRR